MLPVIIGAAQAAVPLATKALLLSGATGAGAVLGKAVGNTVVGAVGQVGNNISRIGQDIASFGQPYGAGQQRIRMLTQRPAMEGYDY